MSSLLKTSTCKEDVTIVEQTCAVQFLKKLDALKKKQVKKTLEAEACSSDRKYDILFWAWDQTESIICVPNGTSKAR